METSQPRTAELSTLAEEIKLDLALANSAVERATRAGELLIKAKSLVPHGQWGSWLDANFPGRQRTCQLYIRLARNPQRVADLGSIREADRELRREKREREQAGGEFPDPEQDDADTGPRTDWPTPAWLFDELNAEFDFSLDPCASAENAKCGRFYTEEDDGLSKPWASETVFMNPPYGREISAWMLKARKEADAGATVVCLVPSSTETAWWNETTHRSELRFRRDRVNFEGGTSALPTGSAVVVMRPDDPEREPVERGGWRIVPRPAC